MVPYDGTQQWHHVHCTLQWHPGATSNPPKWFGALPPIGSKNPYSYRYLGKKREPLWPTCPANLPHLQGLWTHWTIDNLPGPGANKNPVILLPTKIRHPPDRLTCFKPENQRKRRWCSFLKKPIIFNFHVKLWGCTHGRRYRLKKSPTPAVSILLHHWGLTSLELTN